MKIIGITGSPNPRGNSSIIVDAVLTGAKEAGAKTQVFNLNKMNIRGCQACGFCHKNADLFCIQQDDMTEIYEALKDADAVVIGSPVYMAQMNAQTMLFLNRLYALMYVGPDGKTANKIGPKKVVTVYAQGAPMPEHYLPYYDMSDGAFGMMFQTHVQTRIICPGAYTDTIIAEAQAVGRQLTE